MSQVSPDGQYVITTINPSAAGLTLPPTSKCRTAIMSRTSKTTASSRSLSNPRRPGLVQPGERLAATVAGRLGPALRTTGARSGVPTASTWYSGAPRPRIHIRRLASRGLRERSERNSDHYDLYRIPFNNGKGGTPEPIPGASDNGLSNSFPKFLQTAAGSCSSKRAMGS